MVEIRLASTDDIDLLVRLNRTVQDLHVSARPELFKPAESGAVREWFASMLRKQEAWIWLAELDGHAAGYLVAVSHERAEHAFCFARRFCEIDQVAVLPEFRRKGVARVLVEQAAQHASGLGMSEMELSSWSFNEDAHVAFRALGFSPKLVRFERRLLGRAR